jgi:hypothetical protein
MSKESVIEQLEKIAGHIAVEALTLAAARDRINVLYREMEDLAYNSDEASSLLVTARENIETAVALLTEEGKVDDVL